MELKTTEQGMIWLNSLAFDMALFEHRDNHLLLARFEIKEAADHKTSLARLLMSSAPFFGDKPTIFWITENDIWPDAENRVLFAKYRECIAEKKDIDEYVFHIAEANETSYMEGLVALSLYFSWGGFLFDNTGELIVRTSHDDWLEVASPDLERVAATAKWLTQFGLIPIK